MSDNIKDLLKNAKNLDYLYQDHWVELASGTLTEECSTIYCKFYDTPCRKLLFWINSVNNGNQQLNLIGKLKPQYIGASYSIDSEYAHMGGSHPSYYAGNKLYLAEYFEGAGWRITGAGDIDNAGNYETLGVKVTSPFNTTSSAASVYTGKQPVYGISYVNSSSAYKIGIGTQYKLYGVLQAPEQS